MPATALVNPESFIAVSILLPELAATPRPPQVSRVRARPQKNNRYAAPHPERHRRSRGRARTSETRPRSRRAPVAVARAPPTPAGRARSPFSPPGPRTMPGEAGLHVPQAVPDPRLAGVPAPRTQLGQLQRLPVFKIGLMLLNQAVCGLVRRPCGAPHAGLGVSFGSLASASRGIRCGALRRWVSLHVDCRSSVSRTWRCWRRRRS